LDTRRAAYRKVLVYNSSDSGLKEAAMRDRLLLLSLLLLLVASALFADDALSVQVIDQSGHVVKGATVSVARLRDTKFVTGPGVLSTSTDEKGKVSLPLLTAGTYRITVTSPGCVPVQLSAVPIDYAVVPRYRVGNLFVVLNRIEEPADH
jgi:hypothetical protein